MGVTRARRSAPNAAPLFATRHRGLREQLRRLARAADSANTVLLLGGAGAGKDRLARLLHERSSRAEEPFVRVDLAAVADDLFESELFGHERGAFTGAVAGKPGLLEGAGGGTLYLDRIDTLSLRAQAKLLRVVEERLVRRVGGTRQIALRARLVASAAPDLPRRVRAGEFREDLLAAARALARDADGPAAFTPAARALLLAHPWRGNFRELENVIRRAAASAAAAKVPAIDAPHLALASPADPVAFLRAASSAGWTLRTLTDAYIRMVLEDSGGNVAEAARRLGIARKTLYGRKS